MMAPSTVTSALATAGKRNASELLDDDEGYTSEGSDEFGIFVPKYQRRRAATSGMV